MLSWIAGKMIARNMKSIRAGDIEPTLAMDAEEVKFTFPGKSSFAPGANGKHDLEQWLDRFVAIGLQIYPDEVVLKGYPWQQKVCIRGRVYLDDPTAGRVYDNRYVIWGRMSWGKLVEYEVYEDTEKSRELDEYLASGKVRGDEVEP